MFLCLRITLRSVSDKPPHTPYLSFCMPHSAHSCWWGHNLQTFLICLIVDKSSPLSGKNISIDISAQEGFSNSRGPRTCYLIQTVSHLSVAPLGAAHIQPFQGPLVPCPDLKLIDPCSQSGASPDGADIVVAPNAFLA